MKPLLRSWSCVGPALVLALVGLSVACAGTSSGEPELSVDGAVVLSALSDDDANDVCSDFAAYADDALSSDDKMRLGCFAKGVFSSLAARDVESAKTLCTTAFDQCVAKGAAIPVNLSASCKSFRERTSGCQKTVGDYKNCMVDQVNAYKAKLKDPCSSAKPPGDEPKVDAPLRCEPLLAACPGVLTGGPNP